MSIAFMIAGKGRPLILLPFHHNHLERRWALERPGWWIRALAQNNHVVTYDSRGQGLSSRDLTGDLSLNDYRADLGSVVQAAGVRPSVLVAYGGFTHVALRFAVDNPKLVDALVLICTCESFTAWPLASMMTLAEENWDLFLDLELARVPAEFREAVAAFIGATASPADYIRLVRAFSTSSISDILEHVRVPVLILHSVDQHWLSAEKGRRLASKIASARLVILDGDLEPYPVQGVRVIQEFLDGLNSVETGGDEFAVTEAGGYPCALSPRQMEVLRLIAAGKTTREIAEELTVSERTVERHISGVYAKLGVRNRAEATAYALGGFATP